MRIAVDTNILLRFLLADDPVQHHIAAAVLAEAERVVVPKRADVFVSFDKKAVRLLNAAGIPAREPQAD